MHLHDEALAEGPGRERHPLLGDLTQDFARVLRGVDVLQAEDAVGEDQGLPAHGLVEEGLFGLEVAEDGGRGDVQVGGDVGERRGVEAFEGKDVASAVEDLLAGDGRWPSHL